MPTPGQGTIGSLDYPKESRIKLAKKSVSFVCPECSGCGATSQPVAQLLKKPDPEAPSITADAELKNIVMFGAGRGGDVRIRIIFIQPVVCCRSFLKIT